MKLKSITIEGIHNVDKKTYDLSDLTYLHGPNGAGKSTVLQSIQLALLGYIPGTNKTKSDIFRHANSHTMAVTLDIDDDGRPVVVRRVWTGTKSAINSSVDIVPPMYDMDAIVSELELPIFNFNEFVGMTANKLKDWFISFLPSAEVSTDWAVVLKDDADKAGAEVSSEFLDEAVKSIKALNQSGVEEVRSANEYFKSALSFKKKELERSQSTIQSLIYYDDVVEDMSESDIEDKIRSLEAHKQSQEAIFRAAQNNRKIEAQLAELSHCTATSPDGDSRTVDAKKRLELTAADIEIHRADIESARADIESHNAAKYEINERISAIRAEIKVKREVVESKGICPFTKVKCDSVQPMIEQYTSEISESEQQLVQLQGEFNAHTMEIESSNRKIRVAEESIRTLESEANNQRSLISLVDVEYARKQSLESQLVEVPETAVSGQDFDGQIKELRDLQVKYAANRRYSEMIDSLTAQKFVIEQEIIVYKSWIHLTGVNGLQNAAEATAPFINLAAQMNTYIQAVFGSDVSSKFNLESKANSFSFGIERLGTYIPFNLLSSGEKCMYTLSLMLSLVSVSSSPLKVVMVDDLLDHLDDVNVNKMFESLKSVNDIQMIFAGVKSASGDFVVEV